VTSSDIEQTYREEGNRLYYALLAYTGDADVAREAVAEAFARALAHEDSIRDVAPWVWRVAFRVASDDLQHRKRLASSSEIEELPTPEPYDLVEALRHLPERQRASIVLHYYAGYSLNEIASILGTRKGTVGVHLHRGRARLHELLEVEDE
jgi:RNA polymerase sigma-70 factor (ECF subfamily)